MRQSCCIKRLKLATAELCGRSRTDIPPLERFSPGQSRCKRFKTIVTFYFDENFNRMKTQRMIRYLFMQDKQILNFLLHHKGAGEHTVMLQDQLKLLKVTCIRRGAYNHSTDQKIITVIINVLCYSDLQCE